MATRETELPGVGTKHTLDLSDGEQLVVVHHRVGHWELALVDEEGNTTTLGKLQPGEAAELGRILSSREETQPDPRKQMLFDQFSMEWVNIEENSPLVGSTLQGSDIRARTGASVIAILRADESIPSPPPDVRFEAGDTLVVMGQRDQVEQFLQTYSSITPVG
jgi:TrkA domain protein